MTKSLLFLIINTANIGDLLVSTPTIRALRQAFPRAQIDALVNSYNAPVIVNNGDINNVYCYTKAKHRESNQTILGVHSSRLRMLWKLRRARYDYILLAGNGFSVRPYRLARLVGARHLIGFGPDDHALPAMDMTVELRQPERHEVIKMLDLLTPLALKIYEPPRMVLQPAPRPTQLAKDALLKLFSDLSVPVVAIHVSARLTSQRWPAERFVELIHRLNRDCACVMTH